jgi:hypothetical protein
LTVTLTASDGTSATYRLSVDVRPAGLYPGFSPGRTSFPGPTPAADPGKG